MGANIELVFEKIEECGVIPVMTVEDADKAVPLVRAVFSGGIPCAEVTFRSAAAPRAIERIKREAPEILLGAGTVLKAGQVDAAVSAGAAFIVSPGLNPKVVSRCVEKGVAVIPGCITPSDMEAALDAGLEVIKFFPAEQCGGLDYIKAVSAPFPQLKFVPSGGINEANIAKYLGFDKIIACGGSWMVPKEAVQTGDFKKITLLSEKAMMAVAGFSFCRVALYADNAEKAAAAAKTLSLITGFAAQENAASFIAGESIELVKNGAAQNPAIERGLYGHIALGTKSLFRAQAFLERRGFQFNAESAAFDSSGKINSIYLKDQVLGFALRLVQN